MTIGIIEDDTLLHQALKTALQNAGYQTVSAYTKQEALTTITGSESLLLIDIGLPDGNGLACYKKIRGKGRDTGHFPDSKRRRNGYVDSI